LEYETKLKEIFSNHLEETNRLNAEIKILKSQIESIEISESTKEKESSDSKTLSKAGTDVGWDDGDDLDDHFPSPQKEASSLSVVANALNAIIDGSFIEEMLLPSELQRSIFDLNNVLLSARSNNDRLTREIEDATKRFQSGIFTFSA
jgi:hypothetical protein